MSNTKWIVNRALSSGEAKAEEFESYREASDRFKALVDEEVTSPNLKECKIAQVTLNKMTTCFSCGEIHLTQVLRLDARRADV